MHSEDRDKKMMKMEKEDSHMEDIMEEEEEDTMEELMSMRSSHYLNRRCSLLYLPLFFIFSVIHKIYFAEKKTMKKMIQMIMIMKMKMRKNQVKKMRRNSEEREISH